MLTTAEAFEKIRKRLELSETEQKDASWRHTHVRDCNCGHQAKENPAPSSADFGELRSECLAQAPSNLCSTSLRLAVRARFP